MINEASKQRIAMDLIEDKIAKIMVEIRNNNNEDELIIMKNRCEKYLKAREKIFQGDREFINVIIDDARRNKND